MMYLIDKGWVPSYAGGCDQLIYLVTSVERLTELAVPLVFTDRNAVLGIADFTDDLARLDTLIDWPLMRAKMWKNTDAYPDRKERRMAECLVHQQAAWEAIIYVVTKTEMCAQQVSMMLATADRRVPVFVRPNWYF